MDQAMQTAVKRLKNGEILHLTTNAELKITNSATMLNWKPRIAAALKDYQSDSSPPLSQRPLPVTRFGKTLIAVHHDKRQRHRDIWF